MSPFEPRAPAELVDIAALSPGDPEPAVRVLLTEFDPSDSPGTATLADPVASQAVREECA